MTELPSNPLSAFARRPATRGARWFGSLRVRLALAIVATVAVTVGVTGWFSLRAAEEVLLRELTAASLLWFAALATAVLVLVVDLLTRPIVHTPIRQLRQTMERVSEGDLEARAPVSGNGDLADVARGLNQVLDHIANFNDALQARVRSATAELERRNVERVESYHRLLSVREQLASAEQMASIGQTAANVAHQVGTPLNLISGHVQILQEQLAGDPDVARRLAIIEEQIAKVTTTVRSLLDRSRRLGPRTRTTAKELVDRSRWSVRAHGPTTWWCPT